MHRRLPAGPSSPSRGAGSGGFGLHCPLPRVQSKCHFHPFEKKPSWHQAALWNCQAEQLDFNSNLNPGVHPPAVKPTCLVQEETGPGDAHGPSPRRPHRSLAPQKPVRYTDVWPRSPGPSGPSRRQRFEQTPSKADISGGACCHFWRPCVTCLYQFPK